MVPGGGVVIDYDKRDPEDVACDLDEYARMVRDRGAYEYEALLSEAADLIRQFDEIVNDWEQTFFGHMVPPEIARRMVEDRAKVEARMEFHGVTPQEVAESKTEPIS